MALSPADGDAGRMIPRYSPPTMTAMSSSPPPPSPQRLVRYASAGASLGYSGPSPVGGPGGRSPVSPELLMLPKPVGDAGLPFFRPPSAPQVMSYPPLPSPPQPQLIPALALQPQGYISAPMPASGDRPLNSAASSSRRSLSDRKDSFKAKGRTYEEGEERADLAWPPLCRRAPHPRVVRSSSSSPEYEYQLSQATKAMESRDQGKKKRGDPFHKPFSKDYHDMD